MIKLNKQIRMAFKTKKVRQKNKKIIKTMLKLKKYLNSNKMRYKIQKKTFIKYKNM